MPARSRSNDAVILSAVGVLAAAGSAAAIASWAIHDRWAVTAVGALIAFPLFVAVGDALQIPIERRSAFSLALAPALGFALVRTCLAEVASGSCAQWASPRIGEVVAVFLLGSIPILLTRLIRNRDVMLPALAARLLVVLAGTAVHRLVASVAPDTLSFARSGMSGAALAAMIVVVLGVDVAVHSLLTLTEEDLPLRQVVRDQLRATGLLLISTVSVGTLLALAYPTLKAWTLPLFMAPLLATHYSFKQVSSVRKNYLQTVGAMSKVPEMAGYTVGGHSGRVARLSVEMAKELGIGGPQLHDIEYAALLHDIGRVSLPDPDDVVTSISQHELALVGAEIVANTGYFPIVAEIVRRQNEPYRRRGEDTDRTLSIGSKIIKVASAYDDLTQPAAPGRTPWDALERLHLGMAYDYDPNVIQALTRVLEKHGDI